MCDKRFFFFFLPNNEQFRIPGLEAAWRSFRTWSFRGKPLLPKSGVSGKNWRSINANIGCSRFLVGKTVYLFEFVGEKMLLFICNCLMGGLIGFGHCDADGVLSVRTTSKFRFLRLIVLWCDIITFLKTTTFMYREQGCLWITLCITHVRFRVIYSFSLTMWMNYRNSWNREGQILVVHLDSGIWACEFGFEWLKSKAFQIYWFKIQFQIQVSKCNLENSYLNSYIYIYISIYIISFRLNV